ncbi:hypothetical protein CF326_g10091, partial [Tilletia indica]
MSHLFATEKEAAATEDDDDVIILGMEGLGDDIEDVAEVASDVMAGLRRRSTNGEPYQQDAFSAQSGRSDEMSWTFYARELNHRAGMDEGVITAARVASKIYQTFFHLNPRQAILATKNAGIDFNEAQAPVASATGARTTVGEGNITATANLPSPCGEPSYERAAAVTDMKAQTSTLPEGQSWLTPSLNGLQSRLPLSPRFLKAVNRLIGKDTNRRALSFAVSNALGVIERNICNLGVVAGTAAGKSLCWQVDALASLRTDTPSFLLLVVPYVALIADVERVCKEKAIACEPWTKPFHLGPS